MANALRTLGGCGVAELVGVVAFSTLARIRPVHLLVLYTTFKFGWGPLENGGSLACGQHGLVVVKTSCSGICSSASRCNGWRSSAWVSSTLAYLLWGAAAEGWMMYAIVVPNILGAAIRRR